ncbi:MAG: hypothetical protein ACJA0H_000294 [Francisellaceae bacterium]|jgi:hypothetical protein
MKYKLAIFFFGLLAIAIFVLYTSQFTGGLSESHTVWGEFGSFFGGILSPIVSVLAFVGLLYSMEQTKSQFKQQSEESSFYSLLNFYQAKVSQTAYENVTGFDAFKVISNKFLISYKERCFRLAKNKIKNDPSNLPHFSYHLLSEVIQKRSSASLDSDIGKALVVEYFNLSDDKNELFKSLFDVNPSNKERDLLIAIGDTLVRQMPSEQRLDIIGQIYSEFYHDHGHILGHYFRHFYYTLAHADSSTKNDNYAKILRAQMSRYELNLLYYNALSDYTSTKFNTLLAKYDIFNEVYHLDVCYQPEQELLEIDLSFLCSRKDNNTP